MKRSTPTCERSSGNWSNAIALRTAESEQQRKREGGEEQDVEADVQQVRPWVVAARRQYVARPCVHRRIFVPLFFSRAPEVGHVPHRDRRAHRDGAVGHPVIGGEPWLLRLPETDRERDRNTGKDRVDRGGDGKLAPSD